MHFVGFKIDNAHRDNGKLPVTGQTDSLIRVVRMAELIGELAALNLTLRDNTAATERDAAGSAPAGSCLIGSATAADDLG